MMQGDQYYIGFAVTNNALSPVTPEDITDVEITLGSLCKTWRAGQLLFRDGRWFFPVSQAESFSGWPGPVKAQVRLLWRNGVLEGKAIHGLRLAESISKEVL